MAIKYLKPWTIHCYYHFNDSLHFSGIVLPAIFARIYGTSCLPKVCYKQGNEETLGEGKLAVDEMAHCFLPFHEQRNRLSGTYLRVNKARWYQDTIYRFSNTFLSIYSTNFCDHSRGFLFLLGTQTLTRLQLSVQIPQDPSRIWLRDFFSRWVYSSNRLCTGSIGNSGLILDTISNAICFVR